MTASLYCPKCFLADDKLGTCGNFAVGCPTPQPVDPKTMVHITCAPCQKDMVIPVANILKKKVANLGNCVSDKCRARIMQGEAPAATPAPKPTKPTKA